MGWDNRRLLIVEDELLLQELLRLTLVSAGFQVQAASNVTEARECIERFDPDIALLDISLGHGQSGLHLGHLLAETRPDIAVLFLTKHEDARSANSEGLDLPPNAGFLRKHLLADTSYLIDAINGVSRGRPNATRQDLPTTDALAGLSPKRLAVLRLVAEGLSNSSIGEKLGMTTKAVERHLVEIYRQLGLTGRAERNQRVEAVLHYQHAMQHEGPQPDAQDWSILAPVESSDLASFLVRSGHRGDDELHR